MRWPPDREIPPDETKGPMLLGTLWSLWAITIVIYVVRMWARPGRKLILTAADYTITVALVAKTIALGLMSAAIYHGFGRHVPHVTQHDVKLIIKLNLGVFMTSIVASGFARISIACMLLRLAQGRVMKVVLRATIVLQVLVILAYETSRISTCRWGGTGTEGGKRRKKCLPRDEVYAFTFLTFVGGMVIDLVCATVPIFILRNVSRTKVEKRLIQILIASCLVATGFGIPKIYHVVIYDYGAPDWMWNLLSEFFWCRMEEAAIIIAACAPLLKSPVERFLKRMGLPTFEHPVRELNSIHWDTEECAGAAPKDKDDDSSSGPDTSKSWNGSGSTQPDLEAARSNTSRS